MILRCPTCHAKHPVEAFSEDEAARKLLVHAFGGTFPPSLLAYLTLFRSEKRDLPWSKAIKLAEEVMELGDAHRLEAALAATVESLRAKGGKPLKNHNYLKRVLEDTGCNPPQSPLKVRGEAEGKGVTVGKRAQAMQILADWGAADEIRKSIAEGLSALVALNLENAPGADTIAYTADVWAHVLQAVGVAIPEVDAPRVRKAFSIMLGKPLKKWPEPALLKDLLPRRPEREKLREPEPSAEQRIRDKELIREYWQGAGE